MNAERDLSEAYLEWRRLAEAEGEAIGAGNWSLVSACQAALQLLQERISRVASAARHERAKAGGDQTLREKALNATVLELIKIERRNQTLLAAIQEATRTKLGQLQQAGRNLTQLRRSYGSVSPAVRASFS